MNCKLPTANYKAFTLIEILIAISIIAIVFGVLINSYSAVQRDARDTRRQSDLRSLQSALQHYYADNNNYPVNIPNSGAFSFNSKTYLNNIPRDPVANSPYGYEPIPTSCTNVSGQPFCTNYCLYAKLENGPSSFTPTAPCGTGTLNYGNYNTQLTQP